MSSDTVRFCSGFMATRQGRARLAGFQETAKDLLVILLSPNVTLAGVAREYGIAPGVLMNIADGRTRSSHVNPALLQFIVDEAKERNALAWIDRSNRRLSPQEQNSLKQYLERPDVVVSTLARDLDLARQTIERARDGGNLHGTTAARIMKAVQEAKPHPRKPKR